MKITAVKTFVVYVYRTNFIFVKLETDAGLSGVGEGTLEYKERALLGALEDLKDYLIGQDPRLIEKHTFMMYRESYWRTGPVLMSAISAVEMAMWDILGKSCQMPVHALLGGAVLTEAVFAWPGLGTFLVNSIKAKDTPSVLGCVIIFSICFSIVNLCVDLIYAFIDPRIKSKYK